MWSLAKDPIRPSGPTPPPTHHPTPFPPSASPWCSGGCRPPNPPAPTDQSATNIPPTACNSVQEPAQLGTPRSQRIVRAAPAASTGFSLLTRARCSLALPPLSTHTRPTGNSRLTLRGKELARCANTAPNAVMLSIEYCRSVSVANSTSVNYNHPPATKPEAVWPRSDSEIATYPTRSIHPTTLGTESLRQISFPFAHTICGRPNHSP